MLGLVRLATDTHSALGMSDALLREPLLHSGNPNLRLPPIAAPSGVARFWPERMSSV
jgi:hypothetical protein